MRIYIIDNDGITLSREAPAALNEGEIAVASKEELHAAPLSGKRLLARSVSLDCRQRASRQGDGLQSFFRQSGFAQSGVHHLFEKPPVLRIVVGDGRS